MKNFAFCIFIYWEQSRETIISRRERERGREKEREEKWRWQREDREKWYANIYATDYYFSQLAEVLMASFRFLGRYCQMELRQREYAIYCYDSITSGNGSDNSFCHRTTYRSKATTTRSTKWTTIKFAIVLMECNAVAAA